MSQRTRSQPQTALLYATDRASIWPGAREPKSKQTPGGATDAHPFCPAGKLGLVRALANIAGGRSRRQAVHRSSAAPNVHPLPRYPTQRQAGLCTTTCAGA